jgi:hypothetical protein
MVEPLTFSFIHILDLTCVFTTVLTLTSTPYCEAILCPNLENIDLNLHSSFLVSSRIADVYHNFEESETMK